MFFLTSFVDEAEMNNESALHLVINRPRLPYSMCFAGEGDPPESYRAVQQAKSARSILGWWLQGLSLPDPCDWSTLLPLCFLTNADFFSWQMINSCASIHCKEVCEKANSYLGACQWEKVRFAFLMRS